MKVAFSIIFTLSSLLPTVTGARDFAPVLYEHENWRVVRGDNGPFQVCLAQYVLNGKVALIFSKYRRFEEIYFGVPKGIKATTATIQFYGPQADNNTISLDVRSRSTTTVLATTDEIPMLDMAMGASAMTIGFGGYSIKVPLNGGPDVFLVLQDCLASLH